MRTGTVLRYAQIKSQVTPPEQRLVDRRGSSTVVKVLWQSLAKQILSSPSHVDVVSPLYFLHLWCQQTYDHLLAMESHPLQRRPTQSEADDQDDMNDEDHPVLTLVGRSPLLVPAMKVH